MYVIGIVRVRVQRMPLPQFLVVSVISQFTAARVKRKGDRMLPCLTPVLTVKAVCQLTIADDLAFHVLVEQLNYTDHLHWYSMVPQYLPE